MIRSARHLHLAPSSEPEVHPQVPDYLQATAITLGVDGVSVTLLPDAGLRVGSIVIVWSRRQVRRTPSIAAVRLGQRRGRASLYHSC